jgi:16S rRNA C967 or C1407 C5-methylase (RsmB/RsmF family)/NOL1/NOP2/fmu family ribosome biogenesis protein
VQIPEALLESLKSIKGFNWEAFEKVHTSGDQVTSVRFNPAKASMVNGEWSTGDGIHHSPFNIHRKIPWTQYGYYLQQRPSFTFDPLFHAGCYYVQEASSMFLEEALKQTVDLSKPLKILDLCAAPGGKSTHIHSLVSTDSLLVSNEVIRSRASVLKDNIIKWGCENVMVTNNDPKDFARLENYFDVIVVDAPCSGSGLFRRDHAAITEWSENNVQLCSQRQQRILADVWPSLKKDGVMIYSTCSYSKEEDEDIVHWLMNEFTIDYSPLTIHSDWEIIESGGGYRFWPYKVKGEGFFMACIQKKEGETEAAFKTKNKPELVTHKEMAFLEKWVKNENKLFIKHVNTVYAWPEKHIDDLSFLLEQLHVIYSGILVGELMRDKLIPGHALAMSTVVQDTIHKTELEYDQSIQYLQRKEINMQTKDNGWQLATYQGHALGWMNVLPNRINNYYPKNLRIFKDI